MAKKTVHLKKQVTDHPVPWNERAISVLEENRQNLLYLAGGIFVIFLIFTGIILYFKNYESSALKIFTEATALYNIEIQKETAQNYEKPLEAFEKITTLYPRSKVAPFAGMYLGKIYYSTGEFSKASENYETLLQGKIDESLATFARYGLGKTYESMGKFDDALKRYEDILESENSLSSLLLIDMGRLMEKMDRREDAKSKYQEFIEIYPNSPYRSEIIYKMSQL